MDRHLQNMPIWVYFVTSVPPFNANVLSTKLQSAKVLSAEVSFNRMIEKVELYNADWDGKGEWAISFLKIPNGAFWKDPDDTFGLDADSFSKIQKCRVVIMNRSNNKFLAATDTGEVVMKKIEVDPDGKNAHELTEEFLRECQIVWSLEYSNRGHS